tara:strand:+ start:625 stop:975 length:351 start_codon:yes stop_codon:yes gene_type:complete
LSSELKTKWNNLKTKLSVDFSDNEIIDLDSIIFLIGLQELGQFQKRFNKQKKLEVIHIAVCKLLSDYGYYEFDHTDNDGWPHYKLIKKLPNLKAGEQTILMKKAIINYFVKSNYIN